MTGAGIARAIIDAQSFMTLATADEAGVPWASPVWFATEDYRDLYWVSSPTSRHSRNLAVRPELSIVVFDSAATPNVVQAVYVEARAALVADADLEGGLGVFSRASVRAAIGEWTRGRVTGAAHLRLYRATATAHHILDPDAATDTRMAVSL
ncbi:pyridoxamine 5'-phosphate oxidase family protein [Actinophytocola sp.]|uniref:pyridoxamine 5'-phosphate oxidase family protein n=1 Tax=Actinophytocola sp. TaxID=1872138 RepID=UPI002D39DED0|nr:pyridoxamine 5'-phosphate oxidase family protein [Actinophytocola sp.]HYQ67713.1 pyridoxamine 5'-phosphate oxidase family protein [Actinophytocola sp.]